MKVREAMHRGAEWREAGTPLVDIARLMADEDIGAVPIGENDRLVGMVTDRDITCRAVAKGKDCNSLTAADVMTENIVYCREEDDLDETVNKMEKKQIRRVAVLNSDKRLVGMVSMGDVSHAASQQKAGELAASISAHH